MHINDLKKDCQSLVEEFLPGFKFNMLFTQTLHNPYKIDGVWYYDDESKGVYKEPFVCGTSEFIDMVCETENIPTPKALIFWADQNSSQGSHSAKFVRTESGGAWYYSEEYDHYFWLCSHLYDYFETAPEELHLRVK